MSKTAISTLQEYMAKKNSTLPDYVLVSQTNGTHQPSFTIRVSCQGKEACGTASSKKEAKHNAAKEMLKLLSSSSNNNIYSPVKQSLSSTGDSYYSPGFREGDANAFVNSIGKLGEYCVSKGFKNPEYDDSKFSGPDHNRSFTVKCSVGNLSVTGEAKTKKDAKQAAAQNMYGTLVRSALKNNADLLAPVAHQNCIDETAQKLQSIKILDLKKVELSVPLAQAHEKALKMYPQLRARKPVRNMKDIEVKDYHDMLKSYVTTSIREKTLQLLKNVSDVTKEMVLEKVSDLLNVDLEYKSAVKIYGQCVVACSLNTKPVISDVGIGKTYSEAKEKAITNTLRTIDLFLM